MTDYSLLKDAKAGCGLASSNRHAHHYQVGSDLLLANKRLPTLLAQTPSRIDVAGICITFTIIF